ncbi:hypothetical protein BS78_10G259100 [Paspalum vaginatum]|nr:hypothetical protein BS78_10G259100 [Paspalum vaginatum]
MRVVWRRGAVRLMLVSAIAWAMPVLVALAFHLWSCNSVAFLSDDDIEIDWSDFPTGLEEEPGLSLALVEAPVDVIDWDALHIIDLQDEEGNVEIVDENQMYDLLGLRAEDEAAEKASEAAKEASDDAGGDTKELPSTVKRTPPKKLTPRKLKIK